MLHLPVDAAHFEHPVAYAIDTQQRVPIHEELSQPVFVMHVPPGSLFAAAVAAAAAAAAAAAIPSGDAAYAAAAAASQPFLQSTRSGPTPTL